MTAVKQPSLDEFRELIREELDLALADLVIAGEEPVSGALSREESLARLYAMHEAIDEHIQRGEISDKDMAGLQLQMSRLNPADGDEILRRLTQAMNAGELNARF